MENCRTSQAYGAQDIYLTGNPSITFWKTVYRRYTQFSLEAIEQTFNGTVDYGKKVSCTVSRNGDLISTMFLELTLKKSSGASYYPAENFLKEVELEIGGQRVDKHYADWYRMYDELFRSGDEKLAYRRLVDFDTPAAGSEEGVVKKFYVPLIFFFNKNPGLALPLIALNSLQRIKASRQETTWENRSDASRFTDGDMSKLREPRHAEKYQAPRGNTGVAQSNSLRYGHNLFGYVGNPQPNPFTSFPRDVWGRFNDYMVMGPRVFARLYDGLKV